MSDTVHVYPRDDLVEHELEGTDCVCGPAVERVEKDGGGDGWLVIHHSLDGREEHE